jgi:GTP-binding protein Era
MINIYNAEEFERDIAAVLTAGLRRFDIFEKDADIEAEILSEEDMRELNMAEREIDAATDVLSFPATEVKFPFSKKDYPLDINPENGAVLLGEIFICRKRAEEQSEEYGHSLRREMLFLAVHGLLHLLGFDHADAESARKMEDLQEEILIAQGVTRDVEYKTEKKPVKPKAKTEKTQKEAETRESEEVKTGYVAVAGRPNAGKSTLVNALVGEKVSIVSWKPQTTRNRILGIMNTDDAQVMFMDTPGIHRPENALGKFMMRSLTSALESADAVLYVVDGEKGIDGFDVGNIKRYIEEGKKPVAIALNKIDHITKEKAGEILRVIAGIENVAAVVPVSALRKKNLNILKTEIIGLLPRGKRAYPADMYTDRNMRFMAKEIIREKALRLLDKEIPFGIGVNINLYEVRDSGAVHIDADVVCQKDAHKPILLGKGGTMIKKISTYARQDIEGMTGAKVFLTLWVRVKEDWRDDLNVLGELEYKKIDAD